MYLFVSARMHMCTHLYIPQNAPEIKLSSRHVSPPSRLTIGTLYYLHWTRPLLFSHFHSFQSHIEIFGLFFSKFASSLRSHVSILVTFTPFPQLLPGPHTPFRPPLSFGSFFSYHQVHFVLPT